jgi:hypothetical protein
MLQSTYGCAVYAERFKRGPKECLLSQLEDVRVAAARARNGSLGCELTVTLRCGRGVASLSIAWMCNGRLTKEWMVSRDGVLDGLDTYDSSHC